MTVKEWCVQNEDILFTQLETTLTNLKMLKPCMEKLLHITKQNDYNFKILEETWIEFSARVNGHKVNSPDFMLQDGYKFSPKISGIEHTMEYFNLTIRFN